MNATRPPFRSSPAPMPQPLADTIEPRLVLVVDIVRSVDAPALLYGTHLPARRYNVDVDHEPEPVPDEDSSGIDMDRIHRKERQCPT